MLRLDLAATGIPTVVGNEEVLFHSHTTPPAQVAPATVTQVLARHSTPLLAIGRCSPAGTTRAELEAATEALLAALVAAGIAPNLATAGDSGRLANTSSAAAARDGTGRVQDDRRRSIRSLGLLLKSADL